MDLDSNAIDLYRDQGAVLLRRVFSSGDLELLFRGVERNIRHPSRDSFHRFDGEAERGAFTYDYGCHGWIPEYSEFVMSSGLAEIAARMLASKRVCFFDDSYFIKEAGSEHPAPWHHDFTYYEIQGEILVAWVPLDPHGEYETLRLVAGSHGWGKRYPPVGFDPKQSATEVIDEGNAFDALPDLEGGDCKILAWDVEPGDCVLFNGLTLHSSRGNPTSHEQRRFNCRFVDESAVYAPSARYPRGDGKAKAKLQAGQRLSDDPTCFPVVWET